LVNDTAIHEDYSLEAGYFFREEKWYMDYELMQTVIGFVGLITIVLLLWQIASELKWKKINLSLGIVDTSLLEKNLKIIIDFGIDMKEWIMNDKDYNKLIDSKNYELLFKVREILDMFEDFSALYNMNVLNNFFAYETNSENILFYYSKFNKIIEFYRIKDDPLCYKSLEICASKFSKIKHNEQKKFDRRTKKLEKLKQKTMIKLEKLQTKVRC